MIPVFKKVGEWFASKNYCPVSFFSVVSKVFEKLVNKHLGKWGLFSDFQYGFSFSRSTVDFLTVVSDKIVKTFNRSRVTRTVVPDLSKGFDRVCYAGLLFKLKSYGISGKIFGVILSFFRNRWVHVVLDGKSQEYPVNVGVLQSSILGPTLFLLYINEVLLSMLMILLSSLSVITHLIRGNN